ncbi:AraC family transcriptional regulator [Paenibacillus sp. DMB20]|uniref:AraC family transcriptional regulator n=1 Tax=Paenibacillus sp. DMB20 TaxID=1642570 RepID=UPI000627A69C|nr:AraC family transcriptional regulator [Paenibacillus sp. DMB20]KKO54914.1 AraC family transcriptional regulator [Paenibacillus sp. DMB20]
MPRINVDLIHPSSQGQMDLSLLFFGKEECVPGHSWGPGLRDSYLVHYVHSGRGVFSLLDRTYELEAGQGFLIPPSALVFYQADEENPWVYSWFGFRGLHAKSLLQQAGLTAEFPVFRTAPIGNPLLDRINPAGYFEHFHDDLVAVREERGRDALSLSILYRLMAELIRCAPEAVTPRTSCSKESYVRQAIEYIENHYSQKISVQDIARFVGLDRTYLSGLFKSQFGLSLQAFLLEYRMNRAVDLLRNKELTVSDVSRSVGYTDPFLFSKMFKKVTGLSPRNARGTEA